jgi:lycopene beta-cyclase
MENKTFDIVFLGAGCSSFQLLHQLALLPDWKKQKVALFTDGKLQQRSWCFWSKDPHPLQHLVKKSWNFVTFSGNGFSKTENVMPYKYHYIAGDSFFDFFQHDFLSQNPNIEVINTAIETIKKTDIDYNIHGQEHRWASKHVFSSLPPHIANANPRFSLKQHFKGWFIKTEKPVFDDTTLTLMDFSIPQQNDTRFVYVLPFSDCDALMEMTVFSESIYLDAVYEDVLKTYMNQHFPTITFTIEATEKGAIPMTDALFSRFGTEGEVLLGTAAGMVKSTTGYAFKRISQDSVQIAEDVKNNKSMRWASTKGRFRFYDRLLLGILKEEPLRGSTIFEALFRGMTMKKIFKFLDEETNLWEEIRLFSKLPFKPFLKQIYRQWTW